MTPPIAARLAAVRERIAQAAARAGRQPEDVTLVGVSKGQPAAAVVEAVREGLCDVGENYVQEALPKLEEIRAALEVSGHKLPCWHFIGALQRNKARAVAPIFDVVETLDRESLGAELDRRAAAADRRVRALLQVNVSGEPQKAGVAPDAAAALLAASTAWSHLSVVGLMTVPAAAPEPEFVRPSFARLRALRDRLRDEPGGEALRELSMGMSGDFEVAVEEGATIVRVGTALFGPRPR
ncbi:MAG: YggS family pyridoxal phosphate-dependent enzyme [Myxococcota bacterium]|nr:YggS family pyridoxal phosphate-dependent enzyme [Myxococcota bacterium]